MTGKPKRISSFRDYRVMSLVDPYLKTTRAKVHLEDLRARLLEFGKEPCEFIREDDVENQLHIVRVRVRPIPDDIPLIAGDLFYCLRLTRPIGMVLGEDQRHARLSRRHSVSDFRATGRSAV